MFSGDDDTLCEPGVVGTADPHRLCLRGHRESFSTWFYADRNAALREFHRRQLCALDEHEAWLGRSVHAIVRGACEAGPLEMQNACVDLLMALTHRRGRVALTINGIVGDSGGRGSLWVRMCQDRDSRRRLTSDELYRSALSSREIARHVLVPTISHGGPWLSTSFGFENRTLLPPFLPEFRNDEGVMGQILAGCADCGFVAHLPWAIAHVPPTHRTYPESATQWRLRVADLLLLVIQAWQPPTSRASTAAVLTSLGQYLSGVAAQPDAAFDETVQRLVRRWTTKIIANIRRQIDDVTRDGLEYWVRDLRQLLARREASVGERWLAPADAPSPAGGLDLLSRVTRQYGELLSWWPRIIECADHWALAHDRTTPALVTSE